MRTKKSQNAAPSTHSKRLPFFSLLIVIVLLAVLLTPWSMGLIIRHNLDNFFAALKHQSNMKVDIQSYRKGWFSSDVKLSVRNGLLINQNPQDQNTYTYDLHIVHGPLVRDMTSHHWTFAVAAIRLALSLPPQSAAIINSPIVSEGILTKKWAE